MSMGSSDEMQVWIKYCKDLSYFSEEQANTLRKEYQEISKMLKGLYNYVSSQVG
jgi:four helix bundle protein